MKIKEGFVMREIAGQAVVTATGKASENFHGMVKLNSTAKDVWELITKGLDVREIAQTLGEKYGVSADTCEADVLEMIEKMEKAGFLES